jgi:hypothetical protein
MMKNETTNPIMTAISKKWSLRGVLLGAGALGLCGFAVMNGLDTRNCEIRVEKRLLATTYSLVPARATYAAERICATGREKRYLQPVGQAAFARQ